MQDGTWDREVDLLVAGAGPGGADGVGCRHQEGFHRAAFLVVVLHYGPFYLRLNSVLAGHLRADIRVWAFHLVGQCLPNVVQQAPDFGHLHVSAHLCGHHAGQQGDLHTVLKDILSVAETVLQPAK